MLRSQRDSNLRFLNSVCANRRRHCVGHGNLAGSNLCIASSARCIIVAMRTVLSESPSGRMFESRDRLTTSFGVVGGEDARYLNKLRRLSAKAEEGNRRPILFVAWKMCGNEVCRAWQATNPCEPGLVLAGYWRLVARKD